MTDYHLACILSAAATNELIAARVAKAGTRACRISGSLGAVCCLLHRIAHVSFSDVGWGYRHDDQCRQDAPGVRAKSQLLPLRSFEGTSALLRKSMKGLNVCPRISVNTSLTKGLPAELTTGEDHIEIIPAGID